MDLDPRSGSEQRGRRPGIIVSSDAFNANPRWRCVTVVPLTSSERWRVPSPVTVLLDRGQANLSRDCAAIAHQVTTLDKAKVLPPAVGRLSDAKLRELEAALANYLALSLPS
jgi:mRNA interferase MazF